MTKKAEISVMPPAAVPTQTADPILSLIERAAKDPQVDMAKLERLFEVQAKTQAAKAKTSYLDAFSALQAIMPAVARKGTGHNSKKYARFEDLVSTIRPHLVGLGFSLSFRIEQEDQRIKIVGVLGHRDGHTEETGLTLPADKSGSKNDVQAWGSAISYGKRYVALTLLGIATEDDDDGQAAGAAEPISEEQATELIDLIEANGRDREGFCKYFKIERVQDLPVSDLKRAEEALTAKRKS